MNNSNNNNNNDNDNNSNNDNNNNKNNVTSCNADGKGDEMMLAKLEAWVKGGSSAAPHLELLCFLLQSSSAAQRQLLEDASLAARYVLSADLMLLHCATCIIACLTLLAFIRYLCIRVVSCSCHCWRDTYLY